MFVKLKKLRINFKEHNVVFGVNMSQLCDVFMDLVDEETRKKLVKCEDRIGYEKVLKEYFNLNK